MKSALLCDAHKKNINETTTDDLRESLTKSVGVLFKLNVVLGCLKETNKDMQILFNMKTGKQWTEVIEASEQAVEHTNSVIDVLTKEITARLSV